MSPSSPISRRAFLAASATSTLALAMQPATQPARPAYLFTYFTNNGEDGLHLAFSRDGLRFDALNRGKPYLHPQVGESKLMRDPCPCLGPDGLYHMVWTSSWTGKTIGYANTRDFKTWSKQRAIELFNPAPDGLRNCWAPEVVWDDKASHYVIYWSSTITGKFPETARSAESDYNHRLYYVTTKDFQTFTEPKVLIDPGFNTIDGTFLKTRAGQLYLIVKDETKFPKVAKNLLVAKADTYTGPFGKMSPPFTEHWVEGPTAIDLGDRSIVYFDCYTDHRYGAMESTDLENWRDVTKDISFPKGARHGTVLKVGEEILAGLV